MFSKNCNNIIYVGNLPKELTEAQLKRYFNQFGEVLKIRLMKSKKTNRSKGYAFVKFEDEEIAKIAAETMDKYLIDGRSLKVHVKEGDQVVKHLFKRGRNVTLKNRIKLMNKKVDANKRTLEEKVESVLEEVKRGKKVKLDKETKMLVNKMERNLEKLKDKQKKFETDLYDREIETYKEALETLKKHLSSD